MLVAAGLEHKTPAEIADAYEAAFHADEAAVNILPAHVFPRATDHIPEMLTLAEALEDLGYAYATSEGNVYYDVGRFDGYGRLSGNTLADLRAGHRGDIEPDKRDPADFALWKAAGPGRLLKWPSDRWGEGFPGWHIECSAMAMRYLGPQFDIHTGGIDNVFPHHEDEIAQSTPIVGDIPARHWVHGEFLLMDGRKTAKSAGNFQRVTELVWTAVSIRWRSAILPDRRATLAQAREYSDRSIEPRPRRWLCGPARALGASTGRRIVGGTAGPARADRRRPTEGSRRSAGHGTTEPDAFPVSDRAGLPAAPLTPDGLGVPRERSSPPSTTT
jgi:cysteinyl-tRNA synthetase